MKNIFEKFRKQKTSTKIAITLTILVALVGIILTIVSSVSTNSEPVNEEKPVEETVSVEEEPVEENPSPYTKAQEEAIQNNYVGSPPEKFYDFPYGEESFKSLYIAAENAGLVQCQNAGQSKEARIAALAPYFINPTEVVEAEEILGKIGTTNNFLTKTCSNIAVDVQGNGMVSEKTIYMDTSFLVKYTKISEQNIPENQRKTYTIIEDYSYLMELMPDNTWKVKSA